MDVAHELDPVAGDQAPEPILEIAIEDGVCTLTLNRPKARNSLSGALLAALQTALDDIAANGDVRAVILAANGPVFCAGHDLKEVAAARQGEDSGRAFFEDMMVQSAQVMTTIVGLPQPVIAAVQGVASAAGCQLVASCDLALASDKAQFCTPGVDIGLFCSTPMVALSRNISPKHAMEMLLLGDLVSAADAERIGLVNRVTAPEDLKSQAMALATRIASKSTRAIAFGKQAFYSQLELPLHEAYEFANAVMVRNMLDDDACEGIQAFIDKRAPHWRRRHTT